MKTLKVNKDGKIDIPKEHQTDPLHIRAPWFVELHRGRTTQTWYRQKERDKPYITEGFIEINKERYKVEER